MNCEDAPCGGQGNTFPEKVPLKIQTRSFAFCNGVWLVLFTNAKLSKAWIYYYDIGPLAVCYGIYLSCYKYAEGKSFGIADLIFVRVRSNPLVLQEWEDQLKGHNPAQEMPQSVLSLPNRFNDCSCFRLRSQGKGKDFVVVALLKLRILFYLDQLFDAFLGATLLMW